MSDVVKLIVNEGKVVDVTDRNPVQGETVEFFVPLSKVRERLLSDELTEVVAKAEYEDDMGREWPPTLDYQKAEWLDDARRSLSAAALAAFPDPHIGEGR